MEMLSPFRGTPTRIVLPSACVSSYASSITRARPVVSTTTSAPAAPTTSRIAFAMSLPVFELNACEAPNLRAHSTLDSTTSTATIGYADTIAAAWTMFTPTPPTPNTTTDWPTCTAASRLTTPMAVVTAQQNNGA